MFNVKHYGATGDGRTDDSEAIARAVALAHDVPGGAVYFPGGRYRTRQITLRNDGMSITSDGIGVQLLPVANGQTMVKIAASYCSISDISIDVSGTLDGITGIALVPEEETNRTRLSYQNYNTLSRLLIRGCATGIRMRCGPGTTAGESGCWYNTVESVHVMSCYTGITLEGPVANAGGTARAGSGVNRNNFFGVRIGNPPARLGVLLESGDTNNFFGLATEGIDGPGLKVLRSCPQTGHDNNNNRFFGYSCESNTIDIDNLNPRTEFHGLMVHPAKCENGGTTDEERRIRFGGLCIPVDPSTAPLILPGLEYSEGIRGFTSGSWGLKKPLTEIRIPRD